MRRCFALLLFGWTLALAAPDGAAGKGAGDRPTQAIYKPIPRAPSETAGSGLRPLVHARLRIDPRGKVIAVTVTSIDPPSQFDALFRRAAKTSLSLWRFRPAVKDGSPVESETTLAIQFQPLSISESPAERAAVLSLLADDERDARRERILALPETQRRLILEKITQRAEAQISAAKRSEARSDLFIVVTDAPAPDAALKLLDNLEAALASNSDVLSERIPPQPFSDPIRAYVYTSKNHYEKLISDCEGFEWTAGFYHAAGLLAFHLEWPSPSYTLSALIHETTHAFTDRRLVRPGARLPRWLDEGFAEYMGNSDIIDRRLVPGAHKNRFAELRFVPELGDVYFESQAKLTAGTAKSAVREERALSLEELVASTPESFYGEKRGLFYSQSWLAVHFLRHGRPGWSVVQFPRFMLYVAEGYPAGDAFLRVYGSNPSAFEEEYRTYVLSF